MSIEAIAWAYTVDAPARERNILFALALFADEKGENCYPSIDTLAELAQTNRRSVILALNWLKSNGVIELIQKANRYKTSEYRLQVQDVARVTSTSARCCTLLKESLINYVNRVQDVAHVEIQVQDVAHEPAEPTPWQCLYDAFVNRARIMPSGANLPRWEASIDKLLEIGITPEIMNKAFDTIGDSYTITGPWSIEITCGNEMRKNGNAKQISPDEYLKQHATEVY